MMIAETVIVVGTIASYCLPSRRRNLDDSRLCVVSSASVSRYELGTGPSLERIVKNELLGIAGVEDVTITNSGTDYTVKVVLQEMDFVVFEQVANQELALFDRHPDKTFKFEVLPLCAANSGSSTHVAA